MPAEASAAAANNRDPRTIVRTTQSLIAVFSLSLRYRILPDSETAFSVGNIVPLILSFRGSLHLCRTCECSCFLGTALPSASPEMFWSGADIMLCLASELRCCLGLGAPRVPSTGRGRRKLKVINRNIRKARPSQLLFRNIWDGDAKIRVAWI